MGQYINKSALVVEINRIIDVLEKNSGYTGIWGDAQMAVCEKILSSLDTVEVKERVYAILKRSYEFDDFDYGSFVPCFLSLDKEKVIETFKSIKEEEISHFHQSMDRFYKGFLEKHPERAEDFQIVEDTEDYFEIFLDKWCYQWKLTEYELDKML